MIAGGSMLLVLLLVLLFVLKPFSSGKSHSPWSAIPENACAVFRINKPGELMNNPKYKVINENLIQLPAVSILLNGLQKADSLFSATENHKDILKNGHLYISLHPQGQNRMECLYILEPSADFDASALRSEMESTGKCNLSEKDIDGHTCYSTGKKPFFVSSAGNLLIASSSESLLGLALNTTDNESGVSRNEDFNKAASSASIECELNVLVNVPLAYRSLGLLVSGETYSNIAFLQTFSSWGNIDISYRDNAIALSGLFPLKADGKSIMSLFDAPGNNATPQLLNILPANTSAAFSFGFNDFGKFFPAYTKRLAQDQQASFDSESELMALNEAAQTENLESCFYEHITGVLTVFAVGGSPTQEPEVFCAFPIDDADAINKSLRNAAKGNEDWDTLMFRKTPIYVIPVEYGAYSLFGPLFQSMSSTCVAVTDSCVYIGSSAGSLKTLLNNTLSGRTLATSRFGNPLKNNSSTSWNTFSYVNLSNAIFYLQNRWLGDTATLSACEDMYRSQKSGIISLSASRQNDGIVLSGTWIFGKPDSTDALSWFTSLDADVSGNPVVLNDVKTGDYWVAVADVYENLYLLNSEGQLLWKKNLGDPIHSDFQLLFAGKPDQRCFAFTTAKAIYIIDMEGNIRKGFPVTVQEGIASNLLVADYDKNQSYRLLFCDKSGVFNNYSVNSNTTQGWTKPETGLTGECRIVYRPLQGKDYLVVTYSGGDAVVFDRKGKKTLDLKDVHYNKGLPGFQSNFDGKAWVTLSTEGTVIFITPDGEKQTFAQQAFGESLLYTTNNKTVVVIGDGTLFLIDSEGKTSERSQLSESAIEYLKSANSKEGTSLVYLSNDGILGLEGLDFEFSAKNFKDNIQSFDCFTQKDNLILITASGKTLTSEKINLSSTQK